MAERGERDDDLVVAMQHLESALRQTLPSDNPHVLSHARRALDMLRWLSRDVHPAEHVFMTVPVVERRRQDIIAALREALAAADDGDDQIIMRHVRCAYELVSAVVPADQARAALVEDHEDHIGNIAVSWVAVADNRWQARCGAYKLVITHSLGDGSWSFTIDGTGRCYLPSREGAEADCLQELRSRFRHDLAAGRRALLVLREESRRAPVLRLKTLDWHEWSHPDGNESPAGPADHCLKRALVPWGEIFLLHTAEGRYALRDGRSRIAGFDSAEEAMAWYGTDYAARIGAACEFALPGPDAVLQDAHTPATAPEQPAALAAGVKRVRRHVA